MSIDVCNVRLAYGESIIIDDLSLVVPQGKLCSVIGPNGCGKSTLLKAMVRSLKPSKGQIRIDGNAIGEYKTKQLARKLAFLAQSPHIPEQFTVRELVSYGRFPHTGWHGTLTSKDKQTVENSMERTGVLRFAERELVHLSGGERQRVWIAMALAQEAEILLLDEPTTFLDISHQLQVLELISELQRKGNQTVLMVLHDLNHAARYSDYIYVMKNGKLAAQGTPTEIITEKILAEVFSIEVKILHDNDNNCPYFVPLRGIETITEPREVLSV